MDIWSIVLSIVIVLAGVMMVVNPAAVNANKRRKNDKKVLGMIRFTGVLIIALYALAVFSLIRGA